MAAVEEAAYALAVAVAMLHQQQVAAAAALQQGLGCCPLLVVMLLQEQGWVGEVAKVLKRVAGLSWVVGAAMTCGSSSKGIRAWDVYVVATINPTSQWCGKPHKAFLIL
jgi:hypothetical protein